MFYCPCLDEFGELCDLCFNGFTQQHKLVELGPDGRPLFDSPPVPPRDVCSDEEMEDLEFEDGSGEELDVQSPELTRSVASVSRGFRGHQYDDDVREPVSDPYGEYLKRQKVAGKK